MNKEAVMNRWTVLITALVISIVGIIGCSGGGSAPVLPDIQPGISVTPQAAVIPSSEKTYLLGYYDVYFDYETRSFEVTENRTTAFTVNVLPFLNQMISPPNGITLGSVIIHDDDPTFLGVDVEFQVHHPFPGLDQYKAYDLMAVIIGDGANTLNYENLRVGRHTVDLWMKNADGFTRWFNPTEFTTELIFGYAPGGFQNYAGNAHLNPYKYYARGLEPDGDLWEFLASGEHNDGFFQSADGRMMELEFPLPPDGLGLYFGLVVACCWEEQGQNPPGGYTPYHRDEAIAVSVTQTPDVWYDQVEGSGGNLILDIDLFAWEEQPSVVKIESSVLSGISEYDFDTYASDGGAQYSSWHCEAAADTLQTTEGHYFWVIAESQGYDYKNGLPEIPSADGYLAAFFRYDCIVLGEPALTPPVAVATLETTGTLFAGNTLEFDASGSYDTDEGGLSIVSWEWDFDEDDVYGDAYDYGTDDHPFVAIPGSGIHFIDVLVTDNEGLTDTLDEPIEVFMNENIEVISPNGGETLWQAMSHEITWNPSTLGITDVKIEWSTDYFVSDIRTIVASTPNDGSYLWAPIPVEDTTTARIRITNVSGSEYDTSDGDFTIALPVWLDLQATIIVDSGTVTWGWSGSYIHSCNEISPAIMQSTTGTSYIGFYGRDVGSTTYDRMVRSANGTSWYGSPSFWSSGGVNYGRWDYCKVCPSHAGHGWMVTSLCFSSSSTAYGWYSDIDRGNGGPGYYCFDGPSYNFGGGKYTEIGTDSAGYIFMFADNGTSGIQWKKTVNPGFTCGGCAGQVSATYTLTTDGLVSGTRSWARQGQGFALAYFKNSGDIILAETTDAPTNNTFDTSEVVWSIDSNYTAVDDPTLWADSNDRLFCAWVAHGSGGDYSILASMRETSSDPWTDPAIVYTSANLLEDVHISSAPVDLPTGTTEDVAVVCWEESNTHLSALSPLDMMAFLPVEQISDDGATIQQPDGMCMDDAYGYVYDILFASSYNDAGNWDIAINHADFETP